LYRAISTLLNGKKYITTEVALLLADSIDNHCEIDAHKKLSDREFEVFKLFAKGMSVSDISHSISLNVATVNTYRIRILKKLHLHKTNEIIKYAFDMRVT
jgi:DNA-binding NarL/FixJ family response regulator